MLLWLGIGSAVIFGFVMAREMLNKYPTLCSHDFQKSLTNEVELHCNMESGLVHRVSQFGKICNKCTQIIKDSYTGQGECIVCSDTIQEYLRERELCQHDIREYDEIHIKCLNDASLNHDVPFRSEICKKCCDKVRAAFMNSKTCKVCEGREAEVIKDLEKVFISPSYSHIKNILAILQAANAPPETYKNEIQSACKALPRVQRQENQIVSQKLIDEYNSTDREDAHISKRYKLYPKCRKHRSSFITVCNSCLVALLNLDCCPYGCVEEGKSEGKVKKQVNVKFYQTGFLSLYPQLSKNSYYLQLFVIKLIEQKARLDRWQVNIKRITPKGSNQEKFLDNFALYSSAVAVSKKDFFVSGGIVGRSFEQLRPTPSAFVINVSGTKEFQIIPLPPMHTPRSGHSLVFNESRKMVFAIGGYSKEGGFIKSTEVYSIDNQKWFQLGDLNVERSKPTACLYKDHVYVFGGLTSNPKIQQVHAERFNYDTQKWEEISYNGYDIPFTTNSTASTSLLPFHQHHNLLLLGGSNTQSKTNLIQKLVIKEKSFQIDYKGSLLLQYPRENCTLGLINEQTLICFGGVEEHQPFLSIDVVKIKPNDSQLQGIYVNDEIQLGSYRSIAREDGEKFYSRIKDQLKRLGMISEQEHELIKEDGLVTPYNCQLLEKLWFSVGKNYVWLPL